VAVEIGSLVVRASFGGGSREDDDTRLRDEIARLRRDLIDEMTEMLAEADRRARER
jgi:hypothetical protein